MNDYYFDLLVKNAKNQCTDKEKEELDNAINKYSILKEYQIEISKAIELNSKIRKIKKIDCISAYKNINRKIQHKKQKRITNNFMKYAAILVAPLLISTLWLGYLQFKPVESTTQYTTITASPGTIIKHQLPDNSTVWLNSGSQLTYPMQFQSSKREVTLEGEAYFDVSSNPNYPFYVNTKKDLQVYVYGTQFNVCAYSNENYIETTLVEGKVNVRWPSTNAEIQLKPNESLIYELDNTKIIKSLADVNEKTAWKEGKLIFRNTPLNEIFKRLSRHYNVNIEFNNYAQKEYKYRATFRNENISQILDYLSKSATLTWKIQEPLQQSDDTLTKKKIVVNLY